MSNKDRPSMPGTPFRGDDCDRPACDDVKDAMANSGLLKTLEPSRSRQRQPNFASSQKLDCPVNTAQLGQSSWTLLHTMAAWYPDKPSSEDQTMMTHFFNALARFYPCTHCAQDFQDNIKSTPVQVQSREDLAMWLCHQHNDVNEKIGKPLFHCNMKALDERWRQSSNPKCKPSH